MRSWLKTTVIWGVVLGAGFSALELLQMVARRIDYPFAKIADLLLILLIIAVLVKCAQMYRDKYNDGLLSFGRAFGVGAGAVVVAYIFYLSYLLIHFSFIEKDGMDRINRAFENNYVGKLKKETVRRADIDTFIFTGHNILVETNNSVLQDDTLCNSFIDSKLEVMWNSYGERLRLGAATDTANYAYGKFDKYAQNLLINTLEQLLNESSDDTLCTAALSQTVLVAAAALDSASPLQLRLAAERSSIPHYTNALSVSLMHSILVLLYGLFFNIFTSLYIYKKIKNTCGADEEHPEPQNESTNS